MFNISQQISDLESSILTLNSRIADATPANQRIMSASITEKVELLYFLKTDLSQVLFAAANN